MVRYPVGRQQLLDLINLTNPTWIARAKQRTKEYGVARNYTGGSEFWGDIKQVYIDLQHEKCAYCETKLQGAQFASKVHEIEHFRPKQSIKVWPNPSLSYLADFKPPCKMGSANAVGYYLLPYHPFNYAIACTRCNSTLKSNYFPVRGRRNVRGGDPSKMAGEDALLVYPISDLDDDPRDLITFDGVLAVPAQQAGPTFARAVTTIRFFQLNHEDLTTRRAEMLGSALAQPRDHRVESGASASKRAEETGGRGVQREEPVQFMHGRLPQTPRYRSRESQAPRGAGARGTVELIR